MNHIHLKSTPSTQKHLLENFPESKEGILISCDEQSSGVGQYERNWDANTHSLCFSCTLSPNENINLTALEVCVMLNLFFEKEFKQKFSYKWPNDLINENRGKCGGILINRQGENDFVVGIGLNMFPVNFLQDYKIPAGSIFSEKFSFNKEELSLKIYNYFLTNRLRPDVIRNLWQKDCVHLNGAIELSENENRYRGLFLGIGENGQAIMDIDGIKTEFYNGSIII